MSADNWAICPRCHIKAENEWDAKQQEFRQAYGKVSEEEYHRMRIALQVKPKAENTMREDYEFYIEPGTGWFNASYGASCENCGFKHEFHHKEQLVI